MKLLFVGPTLPDAPRLGLKLDLRAPVLQGDVYRAVEEGASVIGLIDGGFEYTAPVWHKEILYALSKGVRVLGAASMGALRAAECHGFGMIGIGEIFRSYRDGLLIDDADVGQSHAPAALGWTGITEPLVNVRATLANPALAALLPAQTLKALEASGAALHFKDRTWRRLVMNAALPHETDRTRLLDLLLAHRIDQKRRDALDLVSLAEALPDARTAPPSDWQFQPTSLWREMIERTTPV
ncbi:antibiotic resistance protein [Rhizobium rhizosphaerae]|uniref:Antibiotic resistance protein n=1 Tax=Xaviernesmea rhizosphaerae TaxID=1672749 RepID=A0A1Q9ACT8_9HYPH|nr:TfuA-like protein [Xaviernesmea rhizosphaerae]OLP52714.1 antibiotic resistance protein [Xaviernesmea rhizosphaerae]